MLPGCMSAWKKLWRNTWVKKISTPFSARRWMSVPRARSVAEVADRHAVDALHDHDVGAAQLPVHLRHVQQRRAGEIALQLRGVGRLAHQVELVEDGLVVFAHHLDRPQAPRLAASSAPRAGQRVQHLEVARDQLAHARAQHLDDDLAAVEQPRHVHLRDRGRGQRLSSKLREQLRERPAVAPPRRLARACVPGKGGTRSCSFASSSAMSAAAGRGAWTPPGRT